MRPSPVERLHLLGCRDSKIGRAIKSWLGRSHRSRLLRQSAPHRRHLKASILPAVRGLPCARLLLPSYFSAMSLRCQASKVSGVAIAATSARTFRAKPLALAANRRRWSSFRRSRRLPSCSRRTRFSLRRQSRPTVDVDSSTRRPRSARTGIDPDSGHLLAHYRGPQGATAINQRRFKQIHFSVHAGLSLGSVRPYQIGPR